MLDISINVEPKLNASKEIQVIHKLR